MNERKARKSYICQSNRVWGVYCAEPDGVIQPGQMYAESYEYGSDPFHPARLHTSCWHRGEAFAKRTEDLNHV